MGDYEACTRPLDQAKTTESGDTSNINTVALEPQHTCSDANQLRQSRTANCVDQCLRSQEITLDNEGHITSVEYPNGVKYEYKNLDDKGQPTCIKITKAGDNDYGEWKKEKDGLWRGYDNGKPSMEVIVGEWQVNEKGELSHTGHQDMRPVQAEKSAPRGASEKVERAADGRVTEVTNANGETTHFKYDDAHGRLTEVKLPGGTVLTTTDGSNWKDSVTGKTSQLNIEVKDNGTYSLERGGKKAVLLPNGNSVRMDVGTADRVTSVTKADGQATSFKYSPDGKLSEVRLPDGTVLSTTDGKTWTNSVTGKSPDLKVEVQGDGTYSREQGGKKVIVHPDGSEVRLDVPSAAPERVTSVVYPDGRTSEFKYGPDGKLNEVKLPGGRVLTTTDGKSWHDSQGGATSEMGIEVKKDGTYSIERDGKREFLHPDGTFTTETTLADGTRILENKDRTQTSYNPDGTYSIAAGVTTQYFDAKGNLTGEVTYDDVRHVLIHTNAIGRIEKTVGGVAWSDPLEREFKYDDKGLAEVKGALGTWRRMEGPAGKQYWQNQEKPDLRWNGKMSVDQHGDLHYTPDDPNAPAWTFKSDGRSVPASGGDHTSASKASTHAAGHKDVAKGQSPRHEPVSVDASVPIPRKLFDELGTPPTVKVPDTVKRK